MSTVADVMTKNPASCRPDTALKDVAQMMIDNDCGMIPVVDDSNKPVGAVTDRDIAIRVVAKGIDSSKATARDAMTSSLSTVKTDMSLEDAIQVMESQKVRRVPVVCANEGTLQGIVSLADVALDNPQATADVVKSVSQPGK